MCNEAGQLYRRHTLMMDKVRTPGRRGGEEFEDVVLKREGEGMKDALHNLGPLIG